MGFPLRFCSCSYMGHLPPFLFPSILQQQWDTSCSADNHPAPHRDISSDALQFSKAAVNGLLFPFLLYIPPLVFPLLILSLSLSLFSFGLELISIWKFVLTILAFFHAGSPDTLLNFIVIKLYAYYLRYYLKWLATSSSHSSWRFEPIISFSMNSQESVNLLIGMIET